MATFVCPQPIVKLADHRFWKMTMIRYFFMYLGKWWHAYRNGFRFYRHFYIIYRSLMRRQRFRFPVNTECPFFSGIGERKETTFFTIQHFEFAQFFDNHIWYASSNPLGVYTLKSTYQLRS